MTDSDDYGFPRDDLSRGPSQRTVGDTAKRPVKIREVCYFPAVLHARLKWLAEREGIPLSDAIRKVAASGMRRYQETGKLPTRDV